ncbi:hypothetical protein B0H63DRAFT_446805 [Podospora didyma]|uniref:DUF3669 domain-containing protein n=1 Tax=Podospora didyma TaxID=330526 RepID=A0AAE0NZK2_9PEZI|nr:hypothetical protein B0H63DRAFT_446805 [Podospora didyma]
MVEIGKGFLATVYTQDGIPEVAFKKEHRSNRYLETNLRHEYEVHLAHRLIKRDENEDDAWSNLDGLWPEEEEDRGRRRDDVFVMDGILPLNSEARRALTRLFLPDAQEYGEYGSLGKMTEHISDMAQNKHCLVRVYLGKAKGKPLIALIFSLRNFPLHLSMMKPIGMDTIEPVTCMGRAFALLHWGAGVNGDDVEFVLGGSHIQPANLRGIMATTLHLLDFGQCVPAQRTLLRDQQGHSDSIRIETNDYGLNAHFKLGKTHTGPESGCPIPPIASPELIWACFIISCAKSLIRSAHYSPTKIMK